MAWFAVDARWTRSVRWLYASRPARLGWYALAELANELRTPGIIPDARDRDRAVADAARMRLGELRACVRDGLAHYADDGSLRLDGWLNVGEDRPPRTESTAPLPPRRAAPLTGAQREQRRAAGSARAAAARRSGGVFLPVLAPADADAPPPAADASAASGGDQRSVPAAPTDPGAGSPPEIRDARSKMEESMSSSSPPSSPLVIGSPAAATAAADGQSSGDATAAPLASANGDAAPHPPPSPSPSPSAAAPAPSAGGTGPNPALRQVGIDRQAVARAVNRGDLTAVLHAFGCQMAHYQGEWQRDVDGLRLAMVAVILGWRREERDAVRLPSGFRHARVEWRRLGEDERYAIAQRMVALYGLPPARVPRPPDPIDPASSDPAGSG